DLHFRPSESIISRLIQFDDLYALAMVLDVNWIGKLIMMIIDSKKCLLPDQAILGTGEWRFSIDQPLTSTMIKQQIRQTEYIERIGNSVNIANIARRSDGMGADLYVREYSAGDRVMYAPLIRFNIY
ncbi:hypothetical protein PMAYCL1PPCAC_20352, partial [Pristionchus mayeri]